MAGNAEHHRPENVVGDLKAKEIRLMTYEICGNTNLWELRWLVRLCWLKLRLGCWLILWYFPRLRHWFSLGLGLRIVCSGPRSLSRLPLFR